MSELNTSLVTVERKKRSKIVEFFKRFFSKKYVNENAVQEIKEETFEEVKVTNPAEDMEILKRLLEGKIKISEIEDQTKIRLITLCNGRLDGVRKQINEKKSEIAKMERLLDVIDSI